ncbi:MAG: tetratricopeptide repeat protein [Chitinivibrionales bacterium]|nr:tetratricopeptide repeat protein [Chitinivibrionales bacterium]
MEIKYSKKKEELRKDPVMDSLVVAKDWVTRNNTTLMGTLIAIIVIAAFFGIYHSMKNSAELKAQDAFGKAMIAYQAHDIAAAAAAFKNVYENFKNTPQSVYCAYMLGYIFLNQQKYDEAINWFKEAISKNKRTNFAGAEPLEALGVCYEAKNNPAEAENYYSQALKDERLTFRFADIKWKLALLSSNKHDYQKATTWCREIMADTLAQKYHRNAQNLLTEIRCMQKS